MRKTFRTIDCGEGPSSVLRALFAPRFIEKVAVHDVNMTVDRGELVGDIGPNGAGKSTAIKMLTGILVPTSGTVLIDGLVPHEKRYLVTAGIDVVFGQRSQLYWDLPLGESFELLRTIYDVARDRFRTNLRHFCEILDLDRFMQTSVRQLCSFEVGRLLAA